ncbi:hypothetical protein H2198_004624 [Neophaeococcomyces mojaviensis]|uniref:Uncharacterized protein n=1 Tax=Neophaeococcomyces mojaviensis TaxID=3383035 RepID=A0ACC3A8X4_9EURO|nr:hypothetical protein H2198_004624 [Knufia sp. JES_112]
MDASTTTSPSSYGLPLFNTSPRTPDEIARIRGTTSKQVEKRREQNRLSQRAYRDRKEKYQRELEDQIAEWKQKQEELVKSYASQTEEVLRLKAQIEVLRTEVVSLQSGLPAMWGQVDQFSQDFDLVPH